jgi:hypothetical protein
MRALRICLALLTVLGGNAFADGPPVPFVCYPPDPTFKSYTFDTSPTITTKNNKAVSFVDTCTKKPVVILYNDDERNALKWAVFDIALAVKNGMTLDQAIYAWVVSQPETVLTAEEEAWRQQLIVAYTPIPSPPPPPPPAPVCKITRQSATVLDRAVYKTVSTAGIASAPIAGVRIAEGTVVPCDSKRGNYYSVAGAKDTQGRTIAAGYALGAQQ